MRQQHFTEQFNKRNLIFILFIVSLVSLKLNAQTFPPGFSQVKIPNINFPTSFAFAPDGRIFVCEKAGIIKIVKNGVTMSTPFATVTVDKVNERGLSSICLDPNFNTNHYVYVYYTSTSGAIHNRLSRFTANGDVAVPNSEQIILEFEPCVGTIHNSGGMAFHSDGTLFLAVGNDNVNSNSQDLNNYKGKILRINPDGSVPAGNPFTGSESAKRIWAYGLRNPWTIAIQPGTNRLFVNEVGENTWEEINDATTAGKNFGWPGSEGMTSNPNYTSPLYTYKHSSPTTDGGCAITGAAFYNPATPSYPAKYIGKYFYIDYCNDYINYLDLNGGVTKYNFATGLPGSNNYLKVGPDGNIYYFSITLDALYKIVYTNNNSPVITMQPSNISVPESQNATFTVSVSGASPFTYQWKKNNINIGGATSASYSIVNAQPADAGQYSVVITNTYGSVTSDQATLTVTAFNSKPHASIITPSSGTFYRSGDIINYSGSGSDTEDGILPDSAFYWYTEFHHNIHYHPGPNLQAYVKNGAFSTNFGETSADVFFRLFLVVKDSGGLFDTAFVDIHPRTSMLNLLTQPSGLQLKLDDQPHNTPYSVLAVSGMTRALDVPTPQIMNDTNYIFDHWSQGGSTAQNISITDSNATYTAVFLNGGFVPSCSATGTITRDYWANVQGNLISNVPVNSTPTSTSSLTLFEGATSVADNYGSRIRGYICPPTNGNYVFWIASDNSSELWLSTTSNPSNKVKIASVTSYTASRQWTKYPSQESAPVYLTAGTKYYIEAIHKEGTQGDNLAVGWKLPDGTLERPIPGSRLSPFSTSGSTAPIVSITSPGNGTTYANPSNITVNANASTSSGSIVKVEFFEGINKIGEDLSAPYSYTWMNVTTGNYTLKAVATNSLGTSGTSAIVNISVASCQTPIIYASGPTTMCSGSVLLKTNAVAGNIYQWKKNGIEISGATSSSYNATSAGQYQVKVIQGSCLSWSAPTTVKIQSGLSASITPNGPTTFCSGGQVTLYANTCSGYSYQWKKDGTNISGATSATYIATASGSYQLKITQGGNSVWSSLINIQVNNCIMREEIADQNSDNSEIDSEHSLEEKNFNMKVYPNPTNGLFTLQLNIPSLRDAKVNMKVVNMLGQEVYNKDFISQTDYLNQTVELSETLKTGVYNLLVTIDNKVESTSIILAK